MALQTSGNSGAETLGFMVQTNLIEDEDVRKGVTAYLESKKPVPRLQTDASTVSKALAALDYQNSLFGVTSPDGKFEASTNPWAFVLVDSSTRNSRVLQTESKSVEKVSFSSDSRKLLAVNFGNLVRVWDVPNGTLICQIKLPWAPDSVKFSHDGKNVEVRHGEEQVVYDENGNKVDSK